MTSSTNAIKQTLHGWHGKHHEQQLRFKCAHVQTIMDRMLMTIIASKLITQD
nr:MAG TPA_asm: hypothetical protein [Caudoviricetes sp.]